MFPARALARSARASLPPLVLRRIVASPAFIYPVSQARLQSTTETAKPKFNRPPMNRKLKDISKQVQMSAEAALPSELAEAIDILEEGASYLREVQKAEGIRDKQLYAAFQSSVALIMEKAASENANLGGRSEEDVLDMLIQYRLAHGANFLQLAKQVIKKEGTESYPAILQLWLKYFEYKKAAMDEMPSVYVDAELDVYKQKGYSWSAPRNLAYFAFVMSCVNGGVEPSAENALKLLGAEELPLVHYVKDTLRKLGANELMKQFPRFERAHASMKAEAMDPNGKYVVQQIERAVAAVNASILETLYEDMVSASSRNDKAITEATLNRLMLGFIEVGRYDRVFDIFRSMLSGGIKKPSINTFDLVFKALGHPNRLKPMTEKERKEVGTTADATLKAMLASGQKMTARTLAYVVGCFANINNFERVDELMKEYSRFTTIDATKNNILIGLVMNNRVAEAEAKLQEYLSKDPSFVPYTYTMNSFFSYYTKKRNFEEAEKLLEFMRAKKIPEDVATITTAIDYYFKLITSRGQVPDIVFVLSKLTNKNFQFTQGTVNTIIDTLTRTGTNLEAARTVYKHFTAEQPRFKFSPAMSTTMIGAELSFGSVYNAETLFDFHINQIRNDARMWNLMIRGLLRHDVDLVVKYFNKFKQQKAFGVQPNYFTFYFMMTHFIRNGLKEKTQWALDELAKADLKDYGNQLPEMVNSLKNDFQVDPALAAKLKV
ncbi:hypothetical_protein [Candidozyma auris]|uniref:hypothetical_protein n=1 Tax=Candidozyma auris TaxID=498019 RepID=UPI000D2C72AE|nr:hypothetical_protein [[Candida] auris]QEO20339.1 hypothetical_protein [[Candida] auris]GBL49688.1 hypothetical protein CAJCM15448_19620 [[Candida] auris]